MYILTAVILLTFPLQETQHFYLDHEGQFTIPYLLLQRNEGIVWEELEYASYSEFAASEKNHLLQLEQAYDAYRLFTDLRQTDEQTWFSRVNPNQREWLKKAAQRRGALDAGREVLIGVLKIAYLLDRDRMPTKDQLLEPAFVERLHTPNRFLKGAYPPGTVSGGKDNLAMGYPPVLKGNGLRVPVLSPKMHALLGRVTWVLERHYGAPANKADSGLQHFVTEGLTNFRWATERSSAGLVRMALRKQKFIWLKAFPDKVLVVDYYLLAYRKDPIFGDRVKDKLYEIKRQEIDMMRRL